jgi:hypothetical protein
LRISSQERRQKNEAAAAHNSVNKTGQYGGRSHEKNVHGEQAIEREQR